MKVSEITEEILNDEIVDKLLFEGLDYSRQTGDLIMVLGCRKAVENRMSVAAELFKNGKAEIILLTGGKVQTTSIGIMSEYEAMSIAAQKLGIPTDKIITEGKSLSTVENFIFSKNIIKDKLPKCQRIILVTTAYHMRRAFCIANKIMPEYEFIPCPANGNLTARDRWSKDEMGRKIVLGECAKFDYYIKKGYIDDFEI